MSHTQRILIFFLSIVFLLFGVSFRTNPQLIGRQALLWELQNNPNMLAFGYGEDGRLAIFFLAPPRQLPMGADGDTQVIMAHPFSFSQDPAPNLQPYEYLPYTSNSEAPPPVAHCKNRTDACRPLKPGTSISNNLTGTLAVKVNDRQNGEALGLSNAHILTRNAKFKCCLGDNIFQPGLADGCPLGDCRVGVLLRWTPVDPGLTQVLYADAGVFRPSGPIGLDSQVWGLNTINSIQPAYVGMPVCKSGITTGVSCGIVTYIDVCVNILGINRTYIYCNQNFATYDSGPGDSGSIVVVNDGVYNKATGLNFADGDYAIFNDIAEVLDQLKVSFAAP
jgi:hypothetical protein